MPNWRAPLIAAGAIGVAALVALAVAFVILTGDNAPVPTTTPAPVVPTTAPPATAPPVTTAPPATTVTITTPTATTPTATTPTVTAAPTP
jgi:hypothetical protein